MKILTASITNAHPEVLRAHLDTLAWQKTPEDVDVDLFYLLDYEAHDQTQQVLDDREIDWASTDPKPQEAIHEVRDDRHHWSESTFAWLAREKQKLLDRAADEGYDAVWLVDSDLLLGPDTLRSLLACERDVVSAVFWTSWQRGQPPLPQVWLRHPYELSGKGWEFHEFIDRLAHRGLVNVGGLGACTLIRQSVLPRVGFYPLVEGLPAGGMAQGEDRHFCARAARNHVELWADAWPDIFHVYFPQDRERIEQQMALLSHERNITRDTDGSAALIRLSNASPTVGDLVSLTIEPCEEPQLAGHKEHVRGRLGQLRLLPDIEDAIREMTVGDDRFVKARFPMWYPVEAYRGQTRTLRVRLLGAKPFAYAPTLDEAVRSRPLAFVHEPMYAHASDHVTRTDDE